MHRWHHPLLLAILLLYASATVQAQWVRTAKTRALSRTNALAVGALGEVYSTGVMTCITVFDSDSLLNNSCAEVSFPALPDTQIDAFLTKHDRNGNLLWVNHYRGSPGNKLFVNDIRLDASGNSYIVGAYTDSLDLHSGPKRFNKDSTTEFFIAKILPDGNTDWVVTYPTDSLSETFARKIAVTGNAVYVTGYVRGNFSIGTHADSVGTDASFLAAFDLNGNFLWCKNFREVNANGLSYGKAVAAIDTAVWVFSSLTDSARVEADTIRPPGTMASGGVIHLYQANGNLLDRYLSTTSYIEDLNVGLPQLSLYATGRAEGVTAIGADTLFTDGGVRAFISSHQLNGNLQWTVPLVATSTAGLTGLALDSNDGSVYASGAFNGAALNAPSSSASGGGGLNGFIIRLDVSGTDHWVQSLGGVGEDAALGVGAPDDTLVFAAGYFSSYIRAAGEERVAPNTNNGFVMRVDTCPQLVADMLSPDSTFICQRDSARFQVTADASYSYRWLKDNIELPGAVTPDLFVKEGGVYSAEITALGCTKKTPVARLFLNALPDSTVITNDRLQKCEGDSVKLSGPLGAYTYLWYNAASILPDDTLRDITVDTDGDYRLRITNALNCTVFSDTFRVRFYPYPQNTLVPPPGVYTLCSGDSLALQADASQPGLSYQWLKDDFPLQYDTLSVFYAKETGVFQVAIKNIAGCETVSLGDTVVLQASPVLDLNTEAIPGEVCQGESVRLITPFVIGQTYQWMRNGVDIPLATLNTLDISASGAYRVLVRNSVCERLSDPFVLTVRPLPVADISNNADTVLCEGDDYRLMAQNVPTYRYQWLRNGQPVAGATASMFSVVQTGNYAVQVTNEFDCLSTSATTGVSVNLKPPASVTAQGETTFCEGQSVQLRANPGTGLTYQWNRNGMVLGAETDMALTVTASGFYSVEVTNVHHCTQTSPEVEVTLTPMPVATINSATGQSSICDRDSLLLTAGGHAPYRFTWLFNAQPVAQADAQHYYAKLPGAYQVVASVNDCRDTSSTLVLSLRPNPLPVITRNKDFLSVASFGDIQWYRDSLALPGAVQQVIQATANGYYRVRIINSEGCTAWSDPVPMCLPVPEIQKRNDVLTVTVPGIRYVWLYEGIPIDGATQRQLTAQQTGSYSVKVTDGTGCAMETSPVIVCIPYPFITRDNFNGLLYANPNPARNYQWYFDGRPITGATTQVHIPDSPGAYSVEVTGFDGCTSLSEPFLIELVTGLGDGLSGLIKVYPNPVTRQLIIESDYVQGLHVTLVDAGGSIVYEQRELTGSSWVIDAEAFNPGIYFVIIQQGTLRSVWKIARQ